MSLTIIRNQSRDSRNTQDKEIIVKSDHGFELIYTPKSDAQQNARASFTLKTADGDLGQFLTEYGNTRVQGKETGKKDDTQFFDTHDVGYITRNLGMYYPGFPFEHADFWNAGYSVRDEKINSIRIDINPRVGEEHIRDHFERLATKLVETGFMPWGTPLELHRHGFINPAVTDSLVITQTTDTFYKNVKPHEITSVDCGSIRLRFTPQQTVTYDSSRSNEPAVLSITTSGDDHLNQFLYVRPEDNQERDRHFAAKTGNFGLLRQNELSSDLAATKSYSVERTATALGLNPQDVRGVNFSTEEGKGIVKISIILQETNPGQVQAIQRQLVLGMEAAQRIPLGTSDRLVGQGILPAPQTGGPGRPFGQSIREFRHEY